jgi:hypothetical protein
MDFVSRVAARAAGLKRYYIGPCKRGHDVGRLVSNGCCAQCLNDRVSRMRRAHPERHAANVLACTRRDYEKVTQQRRARIAANRDEIAAKRAAYRKRERAKINEYRRAYHAANRHKIKRSTLRKRQLLTPEQREALREKRRPYYREYRVRRRAEDLHTRIASALRSRARHSLTGRPKAGSAVHDLGCTIAQFVEHVERQFRDGMTWENWGPVWELDHVRPLGSFDLSDREQYVAAAHHTNYQPLLVADHAAKTARELIVTRNRRHREASNG